MVAVLYACCSKWQLFLPFEFTIDDKSPEDCWSTPISWGWTIWISHGSGWNDYAFVKGEPSLLVIYGMFYGEKWTPTEAIVPSTHPLKRHDTWNLLVFFFRFSLLTIAIRAVSTLNQIWAAKCLTCSSLLLAAKFRCFWVTAHVAACSCLLNFTFLVVSSPCVEFYADRWFGTSFIFPYIGNVIIPADFHIFQRGRAQPPTSLGHPWPSSKVHAKVPPMPGSREARWEPRIVTCCDP